MLYHLARISDSNGIRWNIASDNRTGTDGNVIANGHTWQDGNTATNPYIIPYYHWLCPLSAQVSLYRICTVASCVDADIRTYETIVANRHVCFIENNEIEVRKESFTYTYLLPIIATERLIDKEIIIANVSKQSFQNLLHPFAFRWP